MGIDVDAEVEDRAGLLHHNAGENKDSNNFIDSIDEDEENGDEGEDEEEEDEEEEEFENWSDAQKLTQAIIYLSVGSLMILVFSDPMVDVLTAMGDLSGIDAFYISFIVTPLASNASEVISSLKFAAKKEDKTMGMTLSSLYGAACMNNTFCLSIFLGKH